MVEINTGKQINSVGGLTSRDVIKLMKALEGVVLSFDQLYYYEHTGLIIPSIKKAQGKGVPRLYSVEDFILLRWLVQMNKSGVHVSQFRNILDMLRSKLPEVVKNPENWLMITDGKSIKFFDKVSSRTYDIIENTAQCLFVFPVGKVVEQSGKAVSKLNDG